MAPLPLNPDVTKNRQGGFCHFLNLQEDNVRFVLLAVLLFVYLAIGACIFQAVEEQSEDKVRRDFQAIYDEFIRNFSNCYYPPPPLFFDTSSDNLSENKFVFASSENPQGFMVTNGEDVQSQKEVRDRTNNRPYQVTLNGLHELLFAYGNATQAGVLWKRKRWDWVGSFHFAWTIISTIGYGATTPSTTLGKLLIIPYGFIGCAGGLLFFNLFLERIITFLATCMRKYRRQRQKRRPQLEISGPKPSRKLAVEAPAAAAAAVISVSTSTARRGVSPSRSSTGTGEGSEQPDWKPSVYWVMLCLFVMSITVICTSGVLFQYWEGWDFWESIYFSFVSYATIGLGDYVSLQKQNYGDLEVLYRTVAFGIMVFGCCCIYSLLNVTSIVIKQFLNYVIKRMDDCGDCCCCTYCRCSAARVKRRMSSKKRRRRPRNLGHSRNGVDGARCQISVLNKAQAGRAFGLGHHPYDASGSRENDLNSDGGGGGMGGSVFDLDERRCSGENMISIRGELSNKVSLAVMQKRLYETAQMSRHSSAHNECPGSFSATAVGPLAIVTEKLGDNQV